MRMGQYARGVEGTSQERFLTSRGTLRPLLGFHQRPDRGIQYPHRIDKSVLWMHEDVYRVWLMQSTHLACARFLCFKYSQLTSASHVLQI